MSDGMACQQAMQCTLDTLLASSRFANFLAVDPAGTQLPSFIAVVAGLKPAMDMWVTVAHWSAFERIAIMFGLHYYVDGYFDRYAEDELATLQDEMVTTTRAVRRLSPESRSEAHVFIAREKDALRTAVAAGWYPLVVNGRLVEKHLADHHAFGVALGYPSCCLAFFRQHNDWQIDNTFYAAYRNTTGTPSILANGLLRNTAYYYVPHLPCSFVCRSSMAYSAALRSVIAEEAPAYAAEIDRRLSSLLLCLSELRIYRFEGQQTLTGMIEYRIVEPVNPTGYNDELYLMLLQGTRYELDGCIVRVYCGNRQIAVYQARTDRYGPEAPFTIQCDHTCV